MPLRLTQLVARRTESRYRETLWLIVALALALRLPVMIMRGFWTDEFITIEVARMGWRALTENRFSNGHTPIYFYLIKAWGALFGESQLALRAPSLIFGLATLPLLASLVERRAGRPAALLAALFLALHYRGVWSSAEARPYAAAIFCIVWSQAALAHLLERPTARAGAQYAAGAALAAMLHISTLPVLLAQVAWALWRLRTVPSRRSRIAVALSALAVLGATAAIAALVLMHTAGRGGAGDPVDDKYLIDIFARVTIGHYKCIGGTGLRYLGDFLGLWMLAGAFAAGRRGLAPRAWVAQQFVWFLSSFAILLPLIYAGKFGETHRHFAPIVPAVCVLGALAASGATRKRARAVFALLFTLTVGAVGVGYLFEVDDGVGRQMRAVSDRARETDLCLIVGSSAKRARTIAECYGPLPCRIACLGRDENPAATLDSALAAVPHRQVVPRIWILLYKSDDAKCTLALQQAGYAEIDRSELGDTILLRARRAKASAPGASSP